MSGSVIYISCKQKFVSCQQGVKVQLGRDSFRFGGIRQAYSNSVYFFRQPSLVAHAFLCLNASKEQG